MSKISKYIFTILFLLTSITPFTYASKISVPGGVYPSIVQIGQELEILYDNTSLDKVVDSIILKAPYNQVVIHDFILENGNFEYDTFTKASTNQKITVQIPDNVPEELYDLLIISANDTTTSKRSVKLIKEFKKKHRFIHISDTHITRQ